MKPKIAFESEHIIVDSNNIPVNYIPKGPLGIFGRNQTSDEVIKILEKKYPNIKESGGISKELDACQIEIRNTEAKNTLAEAQDEICSLYEKIEDVVVNDLGLKLLDSAVPQQDFEPVTSGEIKIDLDYIPLMGSYSLQYLSINHRYRNIDTKLKSIGLGIRKATNIAGIHFHIDTEKNNGFKEHKIISKAIREIYKEDKSKLMLSTKRDNMMRKVVLGLIKSGFLQKDAILSQLEPIDFDRTKNIELLEKDGSPKFSYNYVTLKKPGGYTTEVRTPDGVGTLNGLIESTTKIYELIVKYILEQ